MDCAASGLCLAAYLLGTHRTVLTTRTISPRSLQWRKVRTAHIAQGGSDPRRMAKTDNIHNPFHPSVRTPSQPLPPPQHCASTFMYFATLDTCALARWLYRGWIPSILINCAACTLISDVGCGGEHKYHRLVGCVGLWGDATGACGSVLWEKNEQLNTQCLHLGLFFARFPLVSFFTRTPLQCSPDLLHNGGFSPPIVVSCCIACSACVQSCNQSAYSHTLPHSPHHVLTPTGNTSLLPSPTSLPVQSPHP